MDHLTRERLEARVAEALAAHRAAGGRVLAYLGAAMPTELVAAAGFLPFRLGGEACEPDAGEDPVLSHQPPRLRAVVSHLVGAADMFDAAAIARGRIETIQLFAVLRELGRLGRGCVFPVAMLDNAVGPGGARERYNRSRLEDFRAWLEEISGAPVGDDALARATSAAAALRSGLAGLMATRAEGRLTGVETMNLLSAVARLPAEAAQALVVETRAAALARAPLAGRRAYVTGSPLETPEIYAALEAGGWLVVGEDHDRGEASLDAPAPGEDAFAALVARAAVPRPDDPRATAVARVRRIVEQALERRVEAVIAVIEAGDESSPWDQHGLRAALDTAGVALLRLNVRSRSSLDAARLAEDVAALAAPSAPRAERSERPAQSQAPKLSAEGRRSRKALESTAEFGAWQREWFADVRRRAVDGPFAVVNADAPQEILRTLDIPYVINQWWASIVAAKQRGRRNAEALKAAGYPANVETYSAQGLASGLGPADPEAAWGGLPTPDILALVAGSDAGPKLYEAWARETGADLFVFDRTAECRWDLPIEWWEDMPTRWREVLEPARLDLFLAQLEESAQRLQAVTGRTFDMGRFVEVMRLVNEQEDYYRRTRDLIATARPAPIGIVDSMPATMVPQWHRGTAWARDAARKLYEEVAGRAERGEAACPGERLRLMWVGRGLWSDMGFYQAWEESHGAVFVWSMYLGLAADGYIREFAGEQDAMAALAARFITMGDELRMPTWAGAWHVKEARTNGVDAVVAIDDADPFVLEALEAAGFPVCRLALNNMSADGGERAAVVTAFLDKVGSARG